MNLVVLLLIAVPMLVCGLNALLNRCPGAHPHKTPFTAGKYANAVVIPTYLVLHINVFGTQPLPLISGTVLVLIYLNCLVFLNWFVFTLTDVSMHIQLMMQLSRAGSIPVDELVQRYNKSKILGNRVPRLLELDQLKLVDGKLIVTGGSVLFGASVCALLRRILGIPVHPEHADHSK